MRIIFNQKEDELNIKNLIKTIKSSDILSTDNKKFLVNYVTKIENGQINNAFFETDYLVRTIISLLEYDCSDMEEELTSYKNVVKQLLPFGEQTPLYKETMEMIIEQFFGMDGFVNNHVYNAEFYSLFQDKYDYLYIMRLIIRNSVWKEYATIIFNYGIDVSPYCINQQVLKNEVLAFINHLEESVWEIDTYYKTCLEEVKKRCGIYPLDEKQLALISAEALKAQALIEKLNEMKKRVGAYEEKVKLLTKDGKADIESSLQDAKKEFSLLLEDEKKELATFRMDAIKDVKGTAKSSLEEMRHYITEKEKSIEDELDKYLLALEESLKDSSDQVFSSLLTDAQKKIREIKVMAQGLSKTTTSELLRIQRTTEESVDKLKAYVDSEPALQEMLKNVQVDDALKDALLKISEMQIGASTQAIVTSSVPGIVIPGNDRIVVPANPSVVVPENGAASIVIPAFDESIPFQLRIERILAEKERREANGEIFHAQTEEIIRDILEGDWCYLWGPSGCGKTYTIKQIANLIGIDLVNNGKITDKYSIMAYNDPQGRFRATQAFVALVYGKLLFLDELDNGNSDTQVVLNDLYSGLLDVLEKPEEKKYITFAEDMTVPIHPSFRMISAGNTSGEGENQAFSSRGKMDESVQQRMTPKKFWYDNRVEQRIFGTYTNWYNIFVRFREACDAYAVREGYDSPIGIVTTRDAAAIVKYINHNSKGINQVLAEKFVQTKSESYLKFIGRQFQEYYDITDVPKNDFSVSKELGNVKEKDIAKKLVLLCNRKDK